MTQEILYGIQEGEPFQESGCRSEKGVQPRNDGESYDQPQGSDEKKDQVGCRRQYDEQCNADKGPDLRILDPQEQARCKDYQRDSAGKRKKRAELLYESVPESASYTGEHQDEARRYDQNEIYIHSSTICSIESSVMTVNFAVEFSLGITALISMSKSP